jgi:exonuclease III
MGKNENPGVKTFSLNCQSLKPKIKHIRDDPVVRQSDVICLSETWLPSDQRDEALDIDGYELHTNSFGHGRGLATYFRKDKFKHSGDVKEATFQLTKLTSQNVDVISVYRSNGAKLKELSDQLLRIFDPFKTTLVCGDLNICYIADRNNKLIKTLEDHGFEQFVKEATHIQGGLIDHAYVYKTRDSVDVDVSLYSPYYCAKDHDAILIHLDV